MNGKDANELRFGFGENWSRYLKSLTDEGISTAVKSLQDLLGVDNLQAKRFLDVGSGSGLFSLAARILGAEVLSFDFDQRSVACTRHLRDKFFPDDQGWDVEQGSVLDEVYLISCGRFDVVYAWGVLHHTGNMWRAIANVQGLVEEHGVLVLAIYNDQGISSSAWKMVKQLYNSLPVQTRFLILWPAFARLWGGTLVRGLFKGRPFEAWGAYGETRGMSPWHDVVDWVGGYPFEVARRDEIVSYFEKNQFRLRHLNSTGKGHGCNEYVFVKASAHT